MNWAAAGTGFGLGLAYYGGLWVGVRRLKNGRLPRWFALGQIARLALAALTFYVLLITGGPVALVAGLGGLLAARWCLIRNIGGMPNGR